ncbi:tryptophan halogenase family protein [Thalassotalea sp. PLHSN55]|uniref:tryptophan halogenase family protein n=1 Tax=Thalassotalea sp. PLHSN55 TaxID=3435888 RepID=UPI003F874A4B
MDNPIKKIVVVGGGSAGWLTAGTIAAEHCSAAGSTIEVVLIESANIPTIGVGEGTWPSMRNTLDKLGIKEIDFLLQCDASFKQGSKFINWQSSEQESHYYHPFMTPEGYGHIDLHASWQAQYHQQGFADTVNIQSHICEKNLAPKQLATPDYAAVTNYGYHLDATKFAQLLQRHCTSKLNVRHIIDDVTAIESQQNGDIAAIISKEHGKISGDLFIDCTGSAALLIGQHYEVPLIEKRDILFNDSALAVQVPYDNDEVAIASTTNSTAQSAGWIWDIALPTRRGVGYTFSSKHIDDHAAKAELCAYLAQSIGEEKAQNLVDESVRKITFTPGHREKFWHKNCVAVGMAAGFLEPLEASALALIELSTTMICEELPVTRSHMDIIGERFNDRFEYRWQRIIEFLKLHYVISDREDSAYWRDNKAAQSIPKRLTQLLELWQHQPPSRYDFIQNEEVFPSASYQYVLYGMRFNTQQRPNKRRIENHHIAQQLFTKVQQKKDQCIAGLPSNRELLKQLSSRVRK